jgi:hypothetical protein
VGETQRFFWGIVFAFSAATAGVLADEIVHAGVSLMTYRIPIAGYVIVVLLVLLGPLLMFMPRMLEAKIKSLHDYSALAVTHNRMFDGKWVQGDNPKGEPVLGTPEISSLADLGNAYEVLNGMRPVPFDPADAAVLVARRRGPHDAFVADAHAAGEDLGVTIEGVGLKQMMVNARNDGGTLW